MGSERMQHAGLDGAEAATASEDQGCFRSNTTSQNEWLLSQRHIEEFLASERIVTENSLAYGW